MTPPTLIDNAQAGTLQAAIAATPPADALSIATSFATPGALATTLDQLAATAVLRLLLGAEAEAEAARVLRRPGDPPPRAYERQRIETALARMERAMRHARDREPFDLEARNSRQALVRRLRAPNAEIRRSHHAWLPARLLLHQGAQPGVIAGSSNLSPAGLSAAPALNISADGEAIAAQAKAWFDALWHQAGAYDLAALFEEPEQEWPPFLIFLRMLLQFFGEELDRERAEEGDIPLTAFQLHGVWRARRILADYGGVLVADEVGLGKTFIGGAILEAYARSRQRALLVHPAALRRTWVKFLADHNVGRFVESVTFDELGRDRQFADPRRPNATSSHLSRDIDEYQLVVVDEAHNFRTRGAPYRAAVLDHLLRGGRKDLVLLTATPVNNSLWDLRNLLLFFLKQDSALAAKGIPSIARKFRDAAAKDPAELSPDELFPLIDAVTVKRTRGFVRKFYGNETIRAPDGTLRPIVFPKAIPITLRYALDARGGGLFDALADALDPDGGGTLVAFVRYAPQAFRRNGAATEAEGAAGLLRSGLLKRFESSAHAFRLSLDRMVHEHDLFLDALAKGRVITTAFLRELDADDAAFEALLEGSRETEDAADYDVPALRAAVARDRGILADLAARVAADQPDPKLAAVVEALASIAAEAEAEGTTAEEKRRNRKVLLFSSFADTVDWLRGALRARIAADPRLAAYAGRVAAVAGGGLAEEEADRAGAVWGFAPETSDAPPGQHDLFDLLIATDVLAEGLNLQQCRHIINFDLPWNPMRLVQRHGRIDRIGSPHRRVFLRTVFPADRLDALLALEARILDKLAQASRSIGVATAPVAGGDAGSQVFAETRAEIERLAAGESGLFDRGGSEAAAQTGEEYRQLLRAALAADRDRVVNVPGHAGSGMVKGARSGVLFCAEAATAIATRSFLRFVPASADWRPLGTPIMRELGPCLRLAECSETTPRQVPDALREGIFAFWPVARADILDEWIALTDPATMQPKVPLVNRQVATFLRQHPPQDIDAAKLARALDILEAPWPFHEEATLRRRFRDASGPAAARSQALVALILDTGLEPFRAPPPMPPIAADDIRIVCWLAITAAS